MPIETIDKVETEQESATIENAFNGGLDGDFGTDEKSAATETADDSVFGEGSTVDTATSDEAKTDSDDDSGGYAPSEVELELAGKAGIDADLAKGYRSASDIAEAISTFTPRETQVPQAQPVQQPTRVEKPEGFKFEHLEALQEKDEDGEHKFDAGVRGLANDMQRMQEHHAQQMEAATQTIQELRGSTAANRHAQRISGFDTWVGNLGDEFKGILGTGKTADLNPRSAFAQARNKIAEEVAFREDSYAKRGESLPDDVTLFETAKNTVFAAEIQKTAREAVKSEVKKRSRQIINPPNQAKSEGLSINAEIEQARQEFVRRKQIQED